MWAVRPARERGRTYSYSCRRAKRASVLAKSKSTLELRTHERVLVALRRHVVLHVLYLGSGDKVLASKELSNRCWGRFGNGRKVRSVMERLQRAGAFRGIERERGLGGMGLESNRTIRSQGLCVKTPFMSFSSTSVDT